MGRVFDRLIQRPPRHAEVLADVRPLLERLVRAYGVNGVAEMLGVKKAVVSRWTRPKQSAPISATVAQSVIDLYDVLIRALQVYDASVIPDWLSGNSSFFGGARPIDVLRLQGAVPLIQALNAISAGEYA